MNTSVVIAAVRQLNVTSRLLISSAVQQHASDAIGGSLRNRTLRGLEVPCKGLNVISRALNSSAVQQHSSDGIGGALRYLTLRGL